jgi:phosphoribosylglycinamide formyltransferase 1
MLNIIVFISGNGSNLINLIKASKNQQLKAKIIGVICNNPNAAGIKHAKDNQIPYEIIDHKSYPTRKSFEEELLLRLRSYKYDLICLAGFMRILTSHFLDSIKVPIINLHPSLLPSFKGEGAIKQALDYGVKIAGCSVHFVKEEIDSGEIIVQRAVAVENDNLESLTKKIQRQEHLAYIEAINKLA